MQSTDSVQLQFDQFVLDEAGARLLCAGQPVTLPPKAFAVLCELVRHAGQLVTKNALLDAVWGHRHVSESVLKTTISELRAVLVDDARQPRYIETASRRGYRFVAAINSPANISPVNHAASPLNFAPQQDTLTPIIGRQAALAQLNGLWHDSLAGRRQICWIAGEAGIGKTTLIDHFVGGLANAVYAHGQCVEQHGAGEPYLPVLEALSALCRSDAVLPSLLRSVAPTWYLQLPWLGNAQERDDLRRELSGVGQDRMLREFGELLDHYTSQRPLLLVTEDLHWSDRATLDLINHVARRRNPAHLMWLASFRLVEVIAADHPVNALRHELRLHRLCTELALDPFSERELADYIETRFPGSRVSENLVRTLHVRTDGLPLFVVNVIDDLASQGVLESSAWLTGSLQVPESLAGVIEKQIARLTANEISLLKAASVCGVEFRVGVLADAIQQDRTQVAEYCDELVRQQQWLKGPGIERLADGSVDVCYRFRHALYRHVFYQRIGAIARGALHGRVALSLQQRRADGEAVAAAELATHYELSHDLFAALGCFAEAAESALRHFAPKEALELTAHALSQLPHCRAGTERDGIELILTAMRGIACAQLFGVSADQTRTVFERAQQLLELFPGHPLQGMVLHALGLVLMVRGEYAQTRALGERLYAMSQAGGDPILQLSACNLLGQSGTLRGNHDDAIHWLEEGIGVANAVGDRALQAAFLIDPAVTMHGAISIPLLHVGRLDQARACIAEAQRRAHRLGQPMSRVVADWFNALFETRLENVECVAELAADLRRLVDESVIAQGEGPSRWFRGWVDVMTGKPREGYATIYAAFEYNASLGMVSGAAEVLCYGVQALIAARDWDEAEQRLNEASRLAEQLGERVYRTQMHLLESRIAGARGNAGRVNAALQAALHEARAQQSVWLEILALVAICEQNAGPDELAELRDACARMPQARDTPLLRRAAALLATPLH